MRYILLLFGILFIQFAFCQGKKELIESSPMDSVIQYEGEGALYKGNCLFIKFSGNAQLFFNELALFHVQGKNQLFRTALTMAIYETSKPYWVYGRYSVFAEIIEKDEFQLIEIYFEAYNNTGNYKVSSAQQPYQKIINKLLGK